jgi:hypothetical protein
VLQFVIKEIGMIQKVPKNLSLFSMTFLFLVFLLIFGCQIRNEMFFKHRMFFFEVNRLVFTGFKPALLPGDEPGLIRDAISGAVFMAEPVSERVADMMTDIMFEKLIAGGEYDLISPDQAMGAIAIIVESDKNFDLESLLLFQKVGKAFEADAVLVGRIYRWRERIGADYGVQRASSVAFDLQLIRPADGALLWRGRFDKTQQALFGNLLDLTTFFRGKGRWMTAEKLAMNGLEDLVNKMPGKARKDDEPER